MADTPVKLSDMTEALSLTPTDLFYLGLADAQSDTGYYSRKLAASNLAASLLGSFSLPLLFTKTTAKTVAGAVNEIAPVKVTGTLAAGTTSITLSDASITSGSLLKYYSDKWGMYPNAEPVVTSGSVTLSFDAQESAVNIIVEVYN